MKKTFLFLALISATVLCFGFKTAQNLRDQDQDLLFTEFDDVSLFETPAAQENCKNAVLGAMPQELRENWENKESSGGWPLIIDIDICPGRGFNCPTGNMIQQFSPATFGNIKKGKGQKDLIFYFADGTSLGW